MVSRHPRRRWRGTAAAVAVLAGAGGAFLVATGGPAAAANPPLPAPAMSAMPAVDFGRVTPGSTNGAGTQFMAPSSAGTLTASVVAGGDVFSVSSLQSYTLTKQLVDIDPGELPPGHKGPVPRIWEYVTTPDKQVAGSGALSVDAGEMLEVDVIERGATMPATGTLNVDYSGYSVQVPITMFAGAVKVTLGASSLSVPQGRAVDLPVTVQSLGGPGTDVTFTFFNDVPGIRVTNPVVTVASGQMASTALHIVADRSAPTGPHQYDVSVLAFVGPGMRSQEYSAGLLTLTVTDLPVQTVAVPLGAAADAWNLARDPACEVIKDQMGRAVLAATGRTLRDPTCSLQPLQLSAVRQGNTLVLTGTAVGNRVGLFLTTPDGIPGDLDPCFFMFYDVQVTMSITLPATLGAPVRVGDVSLSFSSANGVQSCNATGDAVQLIATALGYGQAFGPLRTGLGDPGNHVAGQVNAALAPLNAALAQAPAAGFTQIDFSLDPNTQILTIRLS